MLDYVSLSLYLLLVLYFCPFYQYFELYNVRESMNGVYLIQNLLNRDRTNTLYLYFHLNPYLNLYIHIFLPFLVDWFAYLSVNIAPEKTSNTLIFRPNISQFICVCVQFCIAIKFANYFFYCSQSFIYVCFQFFLKHTYLLAFIMLACSLTLSHRMASHRIAYVV